MIKNVCIVKHKNTYDLYKATSSDLRTIVESSNWRSGPIGLWEAFNCEFKVVEESKDRECQVGKKQWGKYVVGWDIWPQGYHAEFPEMIDWNQYQVVIAIDIAIPTRIVKQYPSVMWCYYLIESGPLGIDTIHNGSPFYGYNVFLNQRLAKTKMNFSSSQARNISENRRAVLDCPYYIQSSNSIRKLYPEFEDMPRNRITMSHHSYSVLTDSDVKLLNEYGNIHFGYKTIADIHKMELTSKYFIMHPNSMPNAGLGVIEAISAGCLALAPSLKLWGFPEFVNPSMDYDNFEGLMRVLDTLESDQDLYNSEKAEQEAKVQEWCFENPISNLQLIFEAFQKGHCPRWRQSVSEKLSLGPGFVTKSIWRMKNLYKRLCRADSI
jgi:hypothetical protein